MGNENKCRDFGLPCAQGGLKEDETRTDACVRGEVRTLLVSCGTTRKRSFACLRSPSVRDELTFLAEGYMFPSARTLAYGARCVRFW